ncbi:hypothetical protein BEUL_2233 [Bifidobacterium eulemuris]|nr:hypothetical protein BEUL_2233 [Bifidobacterium eulemuris]
MKRPTRFTPQDIEYLLSLPAVRNVSGNQLRYSDEFKKYCMLRYANGDSPVQIFRDAGLEPSLIGHKRIERCVARWKVSELPRLQESDEFVKERDRLVAVYLRHFRQGHNDLPNEIPWDAEHEDDSLWKLICRQQLRRIDELEREVERLRAQLARRGGGDGAYARPDER